MSPFRYSGRKRIKSAFNFALNLLVLVSLLLASLGIPPKTAQALGEAPAPVQTTANGLAYSMTLGDGNAVPDAPAPLLSEQLAQEAQGTEEPRLRVEVEPAIYVPGEPITVSWETENAPAEAMSLAVEPSADIAPDGIMSAAADGSYTVPLTEESGSMEWNVSADATEAVSLSMDLKAGGEVVSSATVVVAPPRMTLAKGQGGTLKDAGESVEVFFPAGAAQEPLLLDARSPSPHAMDSYSLSWNPVEILAVGENSHKNVKTFSEPLKITMHYDETKIVQGDEASLTIYYYDPDMQDWYPMETEVDQDRNTLTAYSNHLTVFDYKANNWQSQSLPTVDAFKTSDFTGSASYAINLWTPPAPGGLQPTVTLSYNSQIIDESTAFSQASWAGMGWDLDTGSVTKNMHGTDGYVGDDTFSISVAGISSMLIPVGGSGQVSEYNTADHAFLKVISHDYDPGHPDSYSFIAWTKDGTRYDFKETIDIRKTDNNCNSLTWRWSLSKVTDIHGNTLEYKYYTEQNANQCKDEIAVYPDTITYGNGKYRVVFVREARKDYKDSWASNASRTLYGTQRLKEVLVQHNASGSWQTVKRYALSYAPNNASNILPSLTYNKGDKTLTLLGIQEFDANGTPLPAVRFTYGDQMHLTKVDNGQGGSVEMTYSAWGYYDDINKDIRSVRASYLSADRNDCYWYDEEMVLSWTKVSGKVKCDGSGLLQVGDNSDAVAERAMPEHMIKPGARYTFMVNVRAISGTVNVEWGIREGSKYTTLSASGINSTGGEQTQQLTLPMDYNPSAIQLRLRCSWCFFRVVEMIQHSVIYRVTQRVVSVQPSGLTSTYTYDYDNGSPNTKDNSAAAASEASPTLYTKILREYRGNALSAATNPEGLTTVNWFYQSDALKGRSYETLTLKRDFYDEMSSLNSNWTTSGGTHTPVKVNQKDFDNSIRSTNGAANWNVSLTRASATLSDGKVAIAHIRLSGASAQGKVGLGSGAVITMSGGEATVNGTPLLSGGKFVKDEWYAVLFFVDADSGIRVRMWQLDDPSNSAEALLGGLGAGPYNFFTSINNGSLDLDSYFEGVPYSETITRYATEKLADGGYTDEKSGKTYVDLKSVWNKTLSVETRNYNGDASFVGSKQEFVYDTVANYGNLLKQTDSYGMDGNWEVARVTEYEYYPNADAYIVSAPARQTVKDKDGNLLSESLTFYDGAASYTTPPTKGDPTMQRVWAGGGDYVQTDSAYNSFGNPVSQSVYAEYGTATSSPPATSKQTTTTTYDSDGYNAYPVSVQNQLGHITTTTYDYALGLPTSVTDANGVTTSATYDGFGRMTKIVAPGDSLDSPTLQITYYDTRIPFQIDLRQKVDASAAIRLSRFYDGAGRLIQSQTVGAIVNGEPKTVVSDSFYNSAGRAIQQTVPYTIPYNASPAFSAQAPSQPSTFTVYDVIGRVKTTTAPNGNVVTNSYTDLTSTVTDPKGFATTATMDVQGRTVLVTPPTGPAVSYIYDSLNRLTDATRAGLTTHIEYDTLGRKLSMDDPDMGSWSYGYDALGNLTSQTDARGCGLTMEYDSLNRLTDKTSSGECGVQVESHYTYDTYPDDPDLTNGIGRRTTMSDASGSALWGYDVRGRTLYEKKTIGGEQFNTVWTYNSADLPITMTYPDNETLVYGYNTDGTLRTVVSNLDAVYLNDMQYDESGRIRLMDYGAGVIRKTYAYFAWNTSVQGGLLQNAAATRSADSASLQNISYTYDANANVETITDALAGPQTQTFTYDSLNRLTSAKAEGGAQGLYSETYAYDEATGNLSLKGALTLTYDANHPHAVASVSGIPIPSDPEPTPIPATATNLPPTSTDTALPPIATNTGLVDPDDLSPIGTSPSDLPIETPPAMLFSMDSAAQGGNTYEYDSNGNQVTRTINGQTFTLVYDAENRLVAVDTEPLVPPTPTDTPTNTPTHTEPAPVITDTHTYTPTHTDTPTATYTDTPTPTDTPTNTATDTPTPTDTDTPTPTATDTPTPTPVDTDTPTLTPTDTDTPTPSETPTPTDTPTPTATPTEIPPEAKPIPAPADYDGDGKIDAALFFPVDGLWKIHNQPNVTFGQQGDIPVPADYDGDNDADIAVFRPSDGTWYFVNMEPVQFGQAGDIPVPADYDNDGDADLAFYRPSDNTWYVKDIGEFIVSDGVADVSDGAQALVSFKLVSDNEADNRMNQADDAETETPTPTETPSETPTLVDTDTPTSEITETPIETLTPSATVGASPSETPTLTLTPSETATDTPTPTSTPPGVEPFSHADFLFDGDGKRVQSTMNGDTITKFVGAHYEVTDGEVTKYYFAGSQRIAMRKNNEVFYMLGDHLGSTSLTTDAAGQVIAEQRYTAWGETRYESGESQSAYTYTGQYSYTKDFGLHFYNARWYDSVTGRFAQADTALPDSTNSQGYDRYNYAENNPLIYNDPSGHFINLAFAAVGAVTGAIIGAASVALPQMIKNAQEGQPLTTNINPTEVGKAAAVGAVAGGVGGLTFGLGLAAGAAIAGAAGITATSGAIASVAGAVTVAASGALAGQASRAATNLMTGQDIGTGLGQPGDMALDAVFSLVTFKAFGGNFNKIMPSSTTGIGAFANDSVSATGSRVTRTQRGLMQIFGADSGCHTCGVRGQGYHGDHQPPTSWAGGLRQSLYPQCPHCSGVQGYHVRYGITATLNHLWANGAQNGFGTWQPYYFWAPVRRE